MLHTRFFDEPLAGTRGHSLMDKDPRVFQATQLADKGAYVEAAELALALLDDGSRDIRVISHYMCGIFMEGGVRTLVDILPRFVRLLTDELHTVTPENKREVVIDSALSRLFRIVAETSLFHAAQKDETWQGWLDALDVATITSILDACQAVQAALADVAEDSQGVTQVTRLARCMRESFLTVLTRREHAEAKRLADEERARAHEQGAARAEPEPDPASGRTEAQAQAQTQAQAQAQKQAQKQAQAQATPEMVHTFLGHEPSPALALLMRKLAAFEGLMERGSMAKAAIVANDIRDTIANFDPISYLPRLFSNYFQILSRSIDELMPYWHESDSPTWQALDQFYRTDLDRFIEE